MDCESSQAEFAASGFFVGSYEKASTTSACGTWELRAKFKVGACGPASHLLDESKGAFVESCPCVAGRSFLPKPARLVNDIISLGQDHMQPSLGLTFSFLSVP